MSELSVREFEITMIMMRALVEKAEDMQEQISNLSRDMETLRVIQKQILEVKNNVTEIKECFLCAHQYIWHS